MPVSSTDPPRMGLQSTLVIILPEMCSLSPEADPDREPWDNIPSLDAVSVNTAQDGIRFFCLFCLAASLLFGLVSSFWSVCRFLHVFLPNQESPSYIYLTEFWDFPFTPIKFPLLVWLIVISCLTVICNLINLLSSMSSFKALIKVLSKTGP